MNLWCRIFGHNWRHDDRTRYVCERCGMHDYGMGGYDKLGEFYRPPPRKWRNVNGKRERTGRCE